MGNKTSKVYETLKGLKLRVILESIIIGVGAGFVISLYRLILDYLDGYTKAAYAFMDANKIYIILGMIVLAIMGYIVGRLVENDGMISGSGIPQVEGILTGYFEVSPVRILITKFIGGVIAIGGGLSLGIEGPSIQLGASVGQIISKLFKRIKLEERFLLTSGAGAGLSAAFNAPLAGAMFAMEEVHKNFSPIILLSAIAAAVSSDLVTWIFFGSKPILDTHALSVIPFEDYTLLIALGIILGFAGAFYNLVLLKTQDLYKKIKAKLRYRMMIPFMFALVFGLTMPQILGGGNDLINNILVNGMAIKVAIMLLVFKFIFSMISFSSDSPGGILFPLLTLGALVGVAFGDISVTYFGLSQGLLMNFILIAMAGMFSSIVRAPLTGLILVCEMSGNFSQLGAVAVVCGVAFLVADLIGSKPIYESLLERRIKANTGMIVGDGSEKVLVKYIVHLGTPIVGKKLKDIKLPDGALMVSVERSGSDIIPNGNTMIRAGDYVVAIVSEDKEANLRTYLEKLCEKEDVN